MVTYLRRLKEKLDRQAGSDFLRRVLKHQGRRGLVNLVRVSVSAVKKEHPPKPDFLPPCLFIEITNRCNLTCTTCPLGSDLAYNGYRQADLSFEQVKLILEQIPSLIYVTLQGVGEPLMNKDILKMLRYCSDKGIATYINTNGTFLNERMSRGLIETGLTNLSISVNSVNGETFALTRSGASVRKVLGNVEKFLELRRAAGAKRPLVSFRAILMKETEPDMEELIMKSGELGVDVLYIQLFMDVIAAQGLKNSALSAEDVEAFSGKLKQWKKKARLQVVTENFGESSGALGQCSLPWFSPNITAEGYVTPCCTIYNPSLLNMGNIFQTPFEQIWNSQKFTDFRAGFYRKQPSACIGCPQYKLDCKR